MGVSNQVNDFYKFSLTNILEVKKNECWKYCNIQENQKPKQNSYT